MQSIRHLFFRITVFVSGVFFLLHGEVLAQVQNPSSSVGYRSQKVVIPASDGLLLKGEVLIPEVTPNKVEAGASPAIVFLNPFGQGYGVYLNVARGYAERGFLVLLFNPRGWHGSQGHTTFDYRLLVQDNKAVLDWLIANYPVTPGRIGLTGISEGGGLALLSSAKDPRISAVSSFSAWGDLSHPSLGNTTRTTWVGILGGLSLLFGEFSEMLKKVRDERQNDPDGERQRQRDREISPIYQVDDINKNGTAVFLSHNFDDILFPVNEILDLYQAIKGPKRLLVKPGFHASAEVLDLMQKRHGLWEEAYEWFDRWLRPSGQETSEGISFALKNEMTSLEIPNGIAPKVSEKVYRLKNGPKAQKTLEPLAEGDVPGDPIEVVSPLILKSPRWRGGAVHTGIPLVSAYLSSKEPRPVVVDIKRFEEPTTLAFWGEVVDSDQMIYGVPKVRVAFRSLADKGQIIPHLLDVAADGTAKLISHGVWSWYQPNPDRIYEHEIHLYGVAWKLAKGHRIMLAFDTRDMEYWPPELGSYELDFAGGRVSTSLYVPVVEEDHLWVR